MAKESYTELINNNQTDDTKKLIGCIDTNLLNSNKFESLYYSFPLIERMIVEIFKLVPDSDVEVYEQGIMRTTMEVIDANNKNNIISIGLVEKIKKYFGENGARNKIFHVESNEVAVNISFVEINQIIMELLEILNKLINEYSEYNYNVISKL